MADVIELALHARARRILQLFLRRHGLDFFLEQREDEHFSRIDNRKVDFVLTLASRVSGPGFRRIEDTAGDPARQIGSCRSMLRRILIRRMVFDLVEAGY
jgi:hypothetical protein